MRKIILVLIVSLLVLPLVPRVVCAGSSTFTHESSRTVNVADATDASPECFISLSRNVSFSYNVADADAQSYSIAAVHYSGDKEYGTASDTTLLFWETFTTGNDITATSPSNSSAVNSWNPL